MKASELNLDLNLNLSKRRASEKSGTRPADLLCSRSARSQTPLARANGTSRRASGWVGEKVARSGRSISPRP